MKISKYVLLLGSVLFVAASTTKQPHSAADQFQSLQERLRQSRLSNEWHANLALANDLKRLLNEAPISLMEAARANVRVGNLKAAMRDLKQFARMGQSSDLIEASPDFAALRKTAQFADFLRQIKENRRAISAGSTVFQLSDPELLAEDIDYDRNTNRFFITSVREGKIVSLDAKGSSADFTEAPDHWPMLAVKVDAERRVVWATEVALKGFSFVPESAWGRSAVICYDEKDGKLLRRIEGPQGGSLGDMVLAANGEVIVSDSDGGGVYRVPLKGSALERLDNGDFISPQTPALHPDGKHIFVPDYARGIGLLEIGTRRVRWLSMAGRFALDGIDGLYFQRGILVAVQNGTSPERVVTFTLDGTLTRIKSETIIEQSTSTLGDPTHGVIVGDDFYYIANSGWDVVNDHGDLKPGATASQARIMRAHPEGP